MMGNSKMKTTYKMRRTSNVKATLMMKTITKNRTILKKKIALLIDITKVFLQLSFEPNIANQNLLSLSYKT